jgi:multicomponent Na+:H+ antiporter subunit C
VNLLLAAAIGILFGSGAYLLLKADLFRIVVGVVIVANAASLALVASAQTRGSAPVYPLVGEVSDPLVQAMTITAVVIGFSVVALLLSLAYCVYVSHRTIDLDEMRGTEARHEHEIEREEVSV